MCRPANRGARWMLARSRRKSNRNGATALGATAGDSGARTSAVFTTLSVATPGMSSSWNYQAPDLTNWTTTTVRNRWD